MSVVRPRSRLGPDEAATGVGLFGVEGKAVAAPVDS